VFNRAIEAVRLKTCQRCRERRFGIDLKEDVCHRYYLRDTRYALPDVRRQPDGSGDRSGSPARADADRGDGDCTGTRLDDGEAGL